MKYSYLPFAVLLFAATCSADRNQKADWLSDGSAFKASVDEKNGFLTLANGLVSRTISLSPDGATTGFLNLMNGNELIRAIKPEAEVVINGDTLNIGGLTGQPVKNYLDLSWVPDLKADSLSPFRLYGYRTVEIAPRFEWKKRAEWMPLDLAWPPPGKRVDFTCLPKNGSVEPDSESWYILK